MTKTSAGLEFDPGFAPFILAFSGTVDYLYSDINRFKNFSQKKTKFFQYHKKILDIFYNNVGFYTGCLMWAAYIKSQPEQNLLSNPCLGQKYDPNENTADTDYVIKFAQLFPKDMKYFLNQNFEFDPKTLKLLEVYRKFLELNKGFTESKLNTDIILPEEINTKNAKNYCEIIDEIIKSGDLSLFTSEIPKILKDK